jgi:hypothetical protein
VKKLVVLAALLALVPAVSPARADALTLRQRVAKLEGRLSCLRRVAMTELNDFAWYGTPASAPSPGPSVTDVYATAGDASVDPAAVDNPDALTDLGEVTGVDWNFGASAPDYFVLAIRASNQNVPYPGCAAKFALQPTPVWWQRSARMTRLRQLARVQ